MSLSSRASNFAEVTAIAIRNRELRVTELCDGLRSGVDEDGERDIRRLHFDEGLADDI